MYQYSAHGIESRAARSFGSRTSSTDAQSIEGERLVYRGGKYVSAKEVEKLPPVRGVTKPPGRTTKPAPVVAPPPPPVTVTPEPAPVAVEEVQTAPVVEVKAEPVPVIDELTREKDAFRAEIAQIPDAMFVHLPVAFDTREKLLSWVDKVAGSNGLEFIQRKFREAVEYVRAVNGFRDELLGLLDRCTYEVFIWFEYGAYSRSTLIAAIGRADLARLRDISAGLQYAIAAVEQDERRRREEAHAEAERVEREEVQRTARRAAEAEQARVREETRLAAHAKAEKDAQRRRDDEARKARAQAQARADQAARESRSVTTGRIVGSIVPKPATKVIDARPIGERIAALTDAAIAEVHANARELKWRYPNRAKLVNAAKNPAGMTHVIAFIEACEQVMKRTS